MERKMTIIVTALVVATAVLSIFVVLMVTHCTIEGCGQSSHTILNTTGPLTGHSTSPSSGQPTDPSTDPSTDPTAEMDIRQIHADQAQNGGTPSGTSQRPTGRISKAGGSPLPKSPVPEDVSILTSKDLPTRRNFMPEVGNGHIATVVQGESIFMNGLYNGANYSSHRARIPSTAGYSIINTTPAGLTRLYSLDLGRGIFYESYSGEGVNVTLRTYAHRSLNRVLVTELIMKRDNMTKDVGVTLHLTPGGKSEDIEFVKNEMFGVKHYRTKEAEYPELAPVTDFYIFRSASLEGNIIMTEGRDEESFLAVTVIGVDKDVVLAEFDLALMAFEDGQLLSNHVDEWAKVWQQGRIDVQGDLSIARLNYACLYFILSSLPFRDETAQWPFVGLSPGGLAHGEHGQDYNGHVFWDQDTWMFPPIALLHPEMGRLMVKTRTRTLEAAKILASRTGYQGARYPWESAFTGLETCPARHYGDWEIHIIGDVSLMVRQYWQLTQDKELMANGSGAELVWETAKFWSSRVTYKKDDDSYRLYGVMPPDEWHAPVNDSVYTNSIAAINLRFANQMAQVLGKQENSTWATIADKLHIPYDAKRDFHPEYEGFYTDYNTKQADVVLLGYPLMVQMNASTRYNDLVIYEKTTPQGPAPAMTWGMFLLGWLELGNETKAAELFNKTIVNAQPPFLVWSENADSGGATNFLTGMGGYLQSVLFGYGGIRIYDDRLTFSPKVIPGTNEVKFTGVKYRGCSLDLQYTEDSLTLTLTYVEKGLQGLEVNFESQKVWQKLEVGKDVQMKRQDFEVRSD